MNQEKSFSSLKQLTDASFKYFNNVLALILVFIILRLFDTFVLFKSFNFSSDAYWVNIQGIIFDIYTALKISGYLIIPYLLLVLLRKGIAEGFFVVMGTLFILINLGLLLYFDTTKIPLGADLYTYNSKEMNEILRSSSSFSIINFIPFFAFPLLWIILWHYIGYIKFPNKVYFVFYPILILTFITSGYSVAAPDSFGSNFNATIAGNKLGFFSIQTLDYIKNQEQVERAQSSNFKTEDTYILAQSKVISKDYPFLHKDEGHDVLGPFFKNFSSNPNIVILLIESLGRSYSGKGADYGSYTPFLDSLTEKSLYFENFLSTAGRTFAVLPSMLGSLPFNVHGFSDMGEKMPEHNSLVKYLKANGYKAYFVYGGDSKFDNMSTFMNKQGVDQIVDVNSSWPRKVKLPPNDQGFSWGYGDVDILQRVVDTFRKDTIPKITVALTLAMHDPFRVPNEKQYNARFKQMLQKQPIDKKKKDFIAEYEQQLSTVIYFDDALRLFFKEFQKLPAYQNTIFIITGDHRMPEIPIATAIDRFRVPLVIYSPMLARTARFSSVSTQFDVTPSLAAMLKAKREMQFPKYASWIGTGLDTARDFRNLHTIPLMENKNEQTSFLDKNDYISKNKLYTIANNLQLKDNNDAKMQKQLNKKLEEFHSTSIYVCSNGRIIPDTLVVKVKIKR